LCSGTSLFSVADCIGTADSFGEIFILFRNDDISCPQHSQRLGSVLSCRNSHGFMSFCSKLFKNMLADAFAAAKNKYLHPIPPRLIHFYLPFPYSVWLKPAGRKPILLMCRNLYPKQP